MRGRIEAKLDNLPYLLYNRCMNGIKNGRLTHNSRILRRNMTPEERRLWYCFLKALPVTVHRQRVIGPYIVDFCCPKAKLVIELDGSQHFEEKGRVSDTERDAFLQKLGFTVLRYTNLDVNRRFSAVCEDIYRYIKGTE